MRLGVGRGPPVANETKEHTRSSMQAYIKCIHQPIKSSACFIMHPWPSTGQWYAIWMICISHSSRYGTLRRKREIPVLVVSARPMSSSSTVAVQDHPAHEPKKYNYKTRIAPLIYHYRSHDRTPPPVRLDLPRTNGLQ